MSSFFSCFTCGGDSNNTTVNTTTLRSPQYQSAPPKSHPPPPSPQRISSSIQQIRLQPGILRQQISKRHQHHLYNNRFLPNLDSRLIVLHSKKNLTNPKKRSSRKVSIPPLRKAMESEFIKQNLVKSTVVYLVEK